MPRLRPLSGTRSGPAGRALIGAAVVALAWLMSPLAPALAAPLAPLYFTIENVVPGATFGNPTAIAFTPDGRLLVAEKRGTVRVIEGGVVRATPMVDLTREVLDNGDRGLLGLAVDPRYALNHRIYLLYTVDPDSDLVDSNVVAFSRLVRYETMAGDSNRIDPATRTVLIGTCWSEAIPSPTLVHPVGGLRFGDDGSLLMTHGDNARHDRPDPGGWDPAQWGPGRSDPHYDIGAFRSQDLTSPNGKLLRLNPDTGHGYASNPFATSDLNATRSKVWAYGFRNPFRLCIRPGSGSPDTAAGSPGAVCVSDVGANTWEELSVVSQGGMNMGWPCREGPVASAMYAPLTPAHHGCTTLGTPDNPSLPTDPLLTWHHSDSTLSLPYGIVGNCASGSAFYMGTHYPQQYRDRLFFTDFGRGWMRVATLDSAQRLVAFQSFATGLEGPVDAAADPLTGDIHYVSIYTGQVRRIRYSGGDQSVILPPVAHGSASDIALTHPATVQFSSLGSYDPGGAALSYAWAFGDNTPGTTQPAPSHIYPDAGEYTAILTVSRADGGLARDSVRIVVVANPSYPATPVIDPFARANGPITPPWAGYVAGLAVRDSGLAQVGVNGYAIWNGGQFGANQEVYVRFDSVTASSSEHDLLLKVQGTTWTTGCIQIAWSPVNRSMALNTYLPGSGFDHRGGPWRDIDFGPGDVWGARALSNGVIEIFKNGEVIASGSVTGWPYATQGGRIGVILQGGNHTRIAEFGGGTLPTVSNLPPRATLLAPLDGAFYVEEHPVALLGTGADDTDAPDSLRYHWDVTLRHNNHIHPSIFTTDSPAGSFVPENHEDGTGTSLLVHLRVTDHAGLAADSTVALWPETDLAPSPIATTPATPTGIGAVEFRFALRNLGRMPGRFSRWMLIADGMAIAQGDTMVPPLDSVMVIRSLAALPAGSHTLRVVADTLGQVVETNETNNGRTQRWATTGFPSARVLDAFERPDAPLAAPWVGSISGLAVRGWALEQTRSPSYAIWNGAVFGPDQEAFVRFRAAADSATEQDLLLKVQGTTWTKGCIQVLYSAPQRRLVINTYATGAGWVRRGGPWSQVTFGPGDQFGARAFANGDVIVYKNGVPIGSTSVAGWAFATLGGRVGAILTGAAGTRWLDFGGGDLAAYGDTPPRAHVVSPVVPAFTAPGDTLVLAAAADDDETPEALRYRWSVDVAGVTTERLGAVNSVVVPAGLTAAGLSARCIVTDASGLADTVEVRVLPEVNLAPGTLVTTPSVAMGSGVTHYEFAIRNGGRAAAGPTRWVLLADGALVDEGDVAVGPLDSARVDRVLPSLPIGPHAMRLVTDSLAAVVETREDDNASRWTWSELPFPNTGVIDRFDRPNGVLAAPWAGLVTRFAVRDSALVFTAATGYAIWNGATFGPDQEAWMRFDSVTANAPEHDLLLKLQGLTWTAGAIQITYSAVQSQIVLNTYDPTVGWVRRGGPWRNVVFVPGDVFGARALSDGRVRVYRNGALVGEASVAAWRFSPAGGKVGLLLNGANATRIVAFGGGGIAASAPPPADPISLPPVGQAYQAMAPAIVPRGSYPNPTQAVAPTTLRAFHRVYDLTGGEPVTIELELPESAPVSVEVYDMGGRLVWSSERRLQPAGRSALEWPGLDANGQPARVGVYLARVTVDARTFPTKLVLVR